MSIFFSKFPTLDDFLSTSRNSKASPWKWINVDNFSIKIKLSIDSNFSFKSRYLLLKFIYSRTYFNALFLAQSRQFIWKFISQKFQTFVSKLYRFPINLHKFREHKNFWTFVSMLYQFSINYMEIQRAYEFSNSCIQIVSISYTFNVNSESSIFVSKLYQFLYFSKLVFWISIMKIHLSSIQNFQTFIPNLYQNSYQFLYYLF